MMHICMCVFTCYLSYWKNASNVHMHDGREWHRHLLYNEQYSQKVGSSPISCPIYFDHEMQMV